MIPVPDLLHLKPRLGVDHQQLHELLGLAFTGRGDAPGIEAALAGVGDESWPTELFARDLFVSELIRDHLRVELDGHSYATNQAFLYRVLCQPPHDLETTRFRQAILEELWHDPELRRRVAELYQRLYDLINMFKIPGRLARLDINVFRIDLFRLVKACVDDMVEGFGQARSGLRRLHQVGMG